MSTIFMILIILRCKLQLLFLFHFHFFEIINSLLHILFLCPNLFFRSINVLNTEEPNLFFSDFRIIALPFFLFVFVFFDRVFDAWNFKNLLQIHFFLFWRTLCWFNLCCFFNFLVLWYLIDALFEEFYFCISIWFIWLAFDFVLIIDVIQVIIFILLKKAHFYINFLWNMMIY